jgi:hypothetical protein
MKKIMFEKLTVKETAHIHGGLYPEFQSNCNPIAVTVVECGEPGLPRVECAYSEPSVECSLSQ